MKNCPKREKLNAIVAEEDGSPEDNVHVVNPLQLVNAITTVP